MQLSDFEFDLPAELIAQHPASDRTAARLLTLSRETGKLAHGHVADLPDLLERGDVLVVNNSKVFAARLLGRRLPGGGAVECLLVRHLGAAAEAAGGGEEWEALVHPGQRLKPGTRLVFDGDLPLHGRILERRFHGRRTVHLWSPAGAPVAAAIDALGHVPLPPYIKRADESADNERYQTIFASRRGSVAAPTAGLHFSAALVAALARRGVEIVELTLHVGYGTFQPIRTERVEDHRVGEEEYAVAPDAALALNAARDEGRRIIAVGTTTTRTLESVAARHEGRVVAGCGSTDLFIYPGYRFRIVQGLLTNFHLPRSSLLVLVAAFAGRDRVLAAYRAAVKEGYRFYSYGDAMLIT